MKSEVCTEIYHQRNASTALKPDGPVEALPDGSSESSGKVPQVFRLRVATPGNKYSLRFPAFPRDADSIAFEPGPADVDFFISENPDTLIASHVVGIPYGLPDTALLGQVPAGDKIKLRLGSRFYLETRKETVRGELHVLQTCHLETDPIGN